MEHMQMGKEEGTDSCVRAVERRVARDDAQAA